MAFLKQKGARDIRYRDLKGEPLTRAELERLAKLVGGTEDLFSKRAIKFRTMGLKDKKLSEKDLLRLMSEEYTFVARPVVVMGRRGVARATPKKLEAILG